MIQNGTESVRHLERTDVFMMSYLWKSWISICICGRQILLFVVSGDFHLGWWGHAPWKFVGILWSLDLKCVPAKKNFFSFLYLLKAWEPWQSKTALSKFSEYGVAGRIGSVNAQDLCDSTHFVAGRAQR